MPQPHENARVFLLIILLLWIISTPDNGGGFISVPALTAARLRRQRDGLAVLNSTRWGDFAPPQPRDPVGTAPRWLNLTGFRESDGLAWEDLDRFRDRCVEWSRSGSRYIWDPESEVESAEDPDKGRHAWDAGRAEPTWQNVTGVVHGGWVRRPGSVERHASSYNLSEIAPPVAWLGARGEWSRNVTGAQGKILILVDDKERDVTYEEVVDDAHPRSGGVVREAVAAMTLQDDASGGSSWEMRLHGVHWPKQGALLLTTTSEKFAGIFGLPHLSPGPDFFQSSQRLLNQTLDEVLRRKERTKFSDPSNPWSSSSIDGPGDSWNPSPHCEYVVYLQVHAMSYEQLREQHNGYKREERMSRLIGEIEEELRNPTGRPIRGVPDLQMSIVMWSPDCSYFLESKGPPLYPEADGEHLIGMKEEVYEYEVRIWFLAFAAVLFAQVHLLKTQVRESSTPSTQGRVSFYTGGVMLLADGLMFASSSAFSLSTSKTFLPSLLVTFMAFISMVIGGGFLFEVYKVQEPERRTRRPEQALNNTTNTTAAAAAGAAATARAAATAASSSPSPAADVGLPRPVTAAPLRPIQRTLPIIIPSDQDIDAEIAENTTAGAAAVGIPTNPAAATATTNTTATPATATAAAAAAAAAAQQARGASFSMSGRFLLLGTVILFLSLAATSWPARVRAAYVNLLAFCYLSLWVPQIWRNVVRNSRRAFAWRFMIGQSVCRLLPFAYFYLREDNIVFADTDWRALAVLAGWLWLQLWALAFQDVLGPRFGVPRGWLPEAWDYHPVLREDALEAGGLPIGLVPGSPLRDRGMSLSSEAGEGTPVMYRTRSREEKEKRDREKDRKGGGGGGMQMRSIDCAICREVIEVPVVPAGAGGGDNDDNTSSTAGAGGGSAGVGAGGVAGVLARRLYMVTPCRHIFHTACLEGWLRFRLQCPICREDLPPL